MSIKLHYVVRDLRLALHIGVGAPRIYMFPTTRVAGIFIQVPKAFHIDWPVLQVGRYLEYLEG